MISSARNLVLQWAIIELFEIFQSFKVFPSLCKRFLKWWFSETKSAAYLNLLAFFVPRSPCLKYKFIAKFFNNEIFINHDRANKRKKKLNQ